MVLETTTRISMRSKNCKMLLLVQRRQRRKVLLATPSYDAPDAAYTFAIARSREALTAADIGSAYLLWVAGHRRRPA
jgi:hypothetical protein